MTKEDFAEYHNPDTIVSVRTTIPQTDTMNRYYGDICRNIDSAFILCGIEQEDGLCLGKIVECPFRHELFGQRICRLATLMALVKSNSLMI
jgi:hypothetical protein